MDKEEFISRLQEAVTDFGSAVCATDGSWVIKGFIDLYRKIYTISADTKVISKIMELYLFPRICAFARDNELELILTQEQNSYPDMTFRATDGSLFAVDLKSSYRKTEETINGMTLGAFTGYFRENGSSKNITFPYNQYKAHIVLGIIYSRVDNIDERQIYNLEDLESICSVAKDFVFFVQEKYKIAIDRPGSGNTKNIGSVNKIESIINGTGLFSELGEDIFNDYWSNYLTKDMAKAAQLVRPYYTNIAEYKLFRHL